MNDQPHACVTVERRLLREQDAVLAVGDFGALFEEYHRHTRRYDLPLDPLGVVMMHQALAGACLQMSFRVVDESSAWTFNAAQPPLNLFVTGGGRDSTITGRYFVDDVQEAPSNRLFVQRSHPKRRTTRSVISVEGIDVLDAFEQYFRTSEQLPARLLELSSTEMAMVSALPGVDAEWLAGLDVAAVQSLRSGAGEIVDGRTFSFHCGCDGDRMADAIVKMFGANPEEIFQGDDGVEVRCPRCGANWWIDRDLFDRRAIGG